MLLLTHTIPNLACFMFFGMFLLLRLCSQIWLIIGGLLVWLQKNPTVIFVCYAVQVVSPEILFVLSQL